MTTTSDYRSAIQIFWVLVPGIWKVNNLNNYVVCCCKLIHESVMSIHSDKLAHVQVVINCWYSIAQICTREDMLALYLGAPFIDDGMRHNTLITILILTLILFFRKLMTTIHFSQLQKTRAKFSTVSSRVGLSILRTDSFSNLSTKISYNTTRNSSDLKV